MNEVLLVRAGAAGGSRATTATLLAQSAHALLDGGMAPAVEGDDDETTVSATREPAVRAQLEQQQRLVADLTAAGVRSLRIGTSAPFPRQRTSSVERDRSRQSAARARRPDVERVAQRRADDRLRSRQNATQLISIQVALGIARVRRPSCCSPGG